MKCSHLSHGFTPVSDPLVEITRISGDWLEVSLHRSSPCGWLGLPHSLAATEDLDFLHGKSGHKKQVFQETKAETAVILVRQTDNAVE